MGHEISQVALRHGTNQRSKAQLSREPSTTCALSGGGVGGALIAQLGSFGGVACCFVIPDGGNTTDVSGTQVLYDSATIREPWRSFLKSCKPNERKDPPEFFLTPESGSSLERVDDENTEARRHPPMRGETAGIRAAKARVMNLQI